MSLSTNSIYAAIGLAEQFDSNNVVLTPMAGTPLHHLVVANNITSDMVFKGEDGQVTFDFFRIEQAANAKEAVFDASRHDYAMNDFAGQAAQAVRNVLYVTRTKVAPRISELLDLITMRLSNAPVSELSNVRITEDEDCPALYTPQLRKLVDQFANYNGGEPRLSINGGELATAEILKYLETGVQAIDEQLITWAAALPEYHLQDAYNNFFTVKNGVRDSRGFYGRMNKSVINMVLVYCIARHLIENDVLLDGVTMDLREYRNALQAIMATTAHLLSIQMERNDSALQNGNMVRSVVMNEIRVFPPVYNEWLKQGGDTDVLYGMAVSGKPKFTVDAIAANQAEYLKAWRSYSSLISSRDSSARFNFLREQLVLAYESILKKPDDEGNVTDPHKVKVEMDKFRTVLKGFKPAECEDLHALCLKLVCRTSFEDSPAEVFLSKMDEEAKRNPKLSPRECGALATLWYISSWVAALIVPVDAKGVSTKMVAGIAG